MKAVINSTELSKNLKTILPVINKNSVMPILQGVLFEFNKKKLTVNGSNLETSVSCSLDCECNHEFSFVIEMSDILKISSDLSEPFKLELKENHVLISTDSSKWKLPLLDDGTNFPKRPVKEVTFSLDVEGSFFFALNNANQCRSKEEIKVNMNSACIDFKKDKIVVVGIDGLIAYKQDFDIKVGKTFEALVPNVFVSLTKSFQEATLSIYEDFIQVSHKNIIVSSKLIDSKFVKYEMVIPKEINYNLTVNTSDIRKALQLSGVTSNSITKDCLIKFSESEITLISSDIDTGKESEQRISVKNSVEIKEVRINAGQMLQLINFFDSDTIEFSFIAPNKKIFLKPTNDANNLCLIQPIIFLNTPQSN